MLNWSEIDTVLLDMDGTLLDLHFDNHFWLEHIPKRYAERHQLTPEVAHAQLTEAFAAVAGTLDWYCLDYWQRELQLPIMTLKRELQHLIRMRDDVPEFLTALRANQKHIVLVTNAHPDSLSLKLERTELEQYCDAMVSTHQFGASKESLRLWERLQRYIGFDPQRTLFIDDSLRILQTAQQFGIRQCLCVANPDSQRPAQQVNGFPSIEHYHELLKDLA